MRKAICVIGLTGLMRVAAAAQGAPPAPPPRVLSLKDAEQEALTHHPLIKAGEYSALAAGETVREMESAYLPTTTGDITAAGAGAAGTRIAAGGLNNPTILNRLAGGFAVSQLVTDFGRTHDLVQSSKLTEQETQKDVDSQRADVLLTVDRAYFDALRAQAVLQVAQETVDTRKTVADQVQALANSNLKSGLDVSFANVNLGEAQLLLVQAQNDLQAAYAALAAALGESASATFQLTDEPQPPPPPDSSAPLIAEALQNRPDVQAQRLSGQAALEFAKAEGALSRPSVSALGVVGWSPYHGTGINKDYSAGGVNVTIPLTNGGLYGARHAAATLKAQALEQITQELQDTVTRDVTVAWLAARSSYQRLDLTNQLLSSASDALDLAQARYNLGLTSIVELTQAQLNKTNAQIEQSTARYDYQAATAALRYQMGELR